MIADDETMSQIAARNALRRRVYPEVAAGGFTRVDGTVEFYTRVNSLLRPDIVVADYGAGRTRFMEDESAPLRRDLCNLQARSPGWWVWTSMTRCMSTSSTQLPPNPRTSVTHRPPGG